METNEINHKSIKGWFMYKQSRCIGLVLVLCAMLGAGVIQAQPAGDCPALVQEALDTTDTVCAVVDRNRVCYGNIMAEAQAQEGISPLTFETPGDQVEVADIHALQLSVMDLSADIWGVAIMKLQANLPDTLPGQNVTIVLFGDVQVTNAVEPGGPEIEMRATSGVNVRQRPSTDASVLRSLNVAEIVTATGRSADNSWIRIALADDPQGAGWVFAQYLTTEGDINTLTVLDPSAPVYGPMQAFYFRSGIGDAPCAEAPESGLLIQTPEGSRRVRLLVNEVEIELGSTAYLQAETGNEMIVNLLEGTAQVTAASETQFVPAGTRVRIPLDDQGTASGAASAPEPYEDAPLEPLPVILLDEEITVQTALTEAEIEDALSAPSNQVTLVNTGGSGTVPLYGEEIFGCGAVSPFAVVGSGTLGTIVSGPRTGVCGGQTGDTWYLIQVAGVGTGWVPQRYIAQ